MLAGGGAAALLTPWGDGISRGPICGLVPACQPGWDSTLTGWPLNAVFCSALDVVGGESCAWLVAPVDPPAGQLKTGLGMGCGDCPAITWGIWACARATASGLQDSREFMPGSCSCVKSRWPCRTSLWLRLRFEGPRFNWTRENVQLALAL